MSLDRIVSFHGIASGAATLPRRVQLVTPETGWQGFVEKYIQPVRELGIRRFLLWMPFGQEVGGPWAGTPDDGCRYQMVAGVRFKTRVRFDQYQQAQAAGLGWLTTGFVEAIRPLVRGGCQVIAYCGTLGGAPEYELVSGHARQQYLRDCLRPFQIQNALCDIAIDSACRSPRGHYVADVAAALRLAGMRVYCESMPLACSPQWAEGDVISVEEQYQNAVNETNRAVLVDPQLIRGELIRMFTSSLPQWRDHTGKPRWDEWYRAKVPGAIGDGHSVCLHVRAFIEQGGKLEELLV